MKLPSASTWDRVQHCPASAVLPQVTEPPSEHAEFGKAGHRFLETALERGKQAALNEAPEEHREKFALLTIGEPGPTTRAEVPLIYNLERRFAAMLEKGKRRDNSEKEVIAIADALKVTDSTGHGSPTLLEYKFGRSWVPRAAENWQLKIGGFIAARATGADEVAVVLLRLDEDGDFYPDAWTFDCFDLDAIEADIHVMPERLARAREQLVANGWPDVHPGPWCRYCPAFYVCPAKISLLVSVLRDPAGWGAIIGAKLESGERAQAYEAIRALEGAVGAAKRQLVEIASYERIPLSDGRFYGLQSVTREEIADAKAALEVVYELYGQEGLEAAETVKTSKAAIERIVRAALGDGEKFRPAYEALLSAIRERGALKWKKVTSMKEYRQQKGESEQSSVEDGE